MCMYKFTNIDIKTYNFKHGSHNNKEWEAFFPVHFQACILVHFSDHKTPHPDRKEPDMHLWKSNSNK